MTYKLPFGLKQKPVRKYVNGGSIGFSISNGLLYGKLVRTGKTFKDIHLSYEIESKEELDKILKSKTFDELEYIVEQSLEIVV